MRFSLERALTSITSIESYTNDRGEGRTERMLGRVISDLRYAEPGQLVASEFSNWLRRLLQQCAAVTRLVHEQYMLGSAAAAGAGA